MVAASYDLESPTAFEIELAELLEDSPVGEETYVDFTPFPPVDRDLAVVVAAAVPASGVIGAVEAAGGDLLTSVTVFDVYRGDGVGEGEKSLALRLRFRAPDRTLSDEEIDPVWPGSSRACPESEAGSVAEPVQPIAPEGAKARVLVAGATGYAGALAAELVWKHPHLELVRVTSRSETGRRLSDLYPRYEVPLELVELDLADLDDVEVGIVAYPHGAAAPVVAEMRGRGLLVVDLSADFRFESLPDLREVTTGPTREPELLDGAVYGLPELNREQSPARNWSPIPGCYPTASILALAPLAEAGLIDDVVIDAKSGVSGAGRGGGEATSFMTITENVCAYKPSGHRHRPEIIEKLSGARPRARPRIGSPSFRTWFRSTRVSWSAVT